MSEKKEFKKFAVIGAGPVGCIVAAYLARGGYEVTLCDVVPELVRAAVDPGIRIEGTEELEQKVKRGITQIDELANDPPDVIIITVKATVLHLIASAIEGFFHKDMYIVSWQNGIDTESVIAETLSRGNIIRAVVNYGCGLVKPGHVHLAFHHPPHLLQELEPSGKTAALAIAQALSDSGLPTERTETIVDMVWRKSIMNACMNPVCAATGLTMAEVIRDPIVFQIVDNLVKESVQVARANEISLGWDYYPYAIDYMKHAGDHKPSMLVDIENKRHTEVDFINGKIVEYGRQAGIETPYNLMIRALVKALEPK
ncbi:MAG TPA: 2-dehydropantoate 2-reductase [Proteobacteria bacterium]|nr:2-dehydropantoate 2-reductase [Pseudomonadota bacterium]